MQKKKKDQYYELSHLTIAGLYKTQTSSSVLNDCNRDRRADFTVIGRPWYKLSLALGGRESGRETCIGTHALFRV
jgi:hypothetical protein